MSEHPPTRPRFAEGTDRGEALPVLERLLNEHNECRWRLTPDATGIHKKFRFKTFRSTWAFMNSVAEQCNAERHHPEWTNVRLISFTGPKKTSADFREIYNQVTITWTTHQPKGITIKDLRMAKFCDEQATVHGEIT
ncbi:transcriptional coactivator/pterin dehydratase [Lipomyces kononenkoae]